MNTQDETGNVDGAEETSQTVATCTVVPTPPTPSRVKKPFDGRVLPDAEILAKQVRIKTVKGDIVFELLPAEAPCAVSNFVTLIKQGYYDGLVFHRVVPGFVIQGGDPVGDGTGGPGYRFGDEPVKLSYDKGIVAMANAGPNTNGSQFFVMLESQYLPPQYTIFGRVLAGQDVVDKIQMGDVMESVTIEPIKTAS
ncbi:MAG: peptidylprolyl isomerase [bacterium]|nr:peptidylprolyl isomerase [bacterium]